MVGKWKDSEPGGGSFFPGKVYSFLHRVWQEIIELISFTGICIPVLLGDGSLAL